MEGGINLTVRYDIDTDADDRCSRLMRRYDSLVGTVNFYEAKLKQQSSDVVLTEKVQSRLEQEETAWEQAMEEREVRVAQLKVELRELQQDGEDEDEQKDDAEADMVMESEVAAIENQGLREALALRMEEKRDIEAAIQALRRKKRQRGGPASSTTIEAEASPLHDELARLMAEKEELQAAIYSMEAEQEQAEAEQQGVAALKETLEQRKLERQKLQDELDRQRHFLTRVKAKMTHMVDVQLLAARDTNPPTISEEMVILHLLYQHAGEMEMSELKKATTEMLATYGKETSSGAVVRALYSLVASLAVHIDRTMGNGVVTSLLV
jgi:chromosome segregation ATPase